MELHKKFAQIANVTKNTDDPAWTVALIVLRFIRNYCVPN